MVIGAWAEGYEAIDKVAGFEYKREAKRWEMGGIMKEYNRMNIPRAKALRRNMTPWERKLWYEFLRGYPVRFQRQKAIGNYIADFYCAKARLIVEVDGGGHYTEQQTARDKLRTSELESMKLTVVRISNLDIDSHFDGVCEYIAMAVEQALCLSSSSDGCSCVTDRVFRREICDRI